MAKERVRIPETTRNQVLREFRHRCAKCGADEPQLHHIDEDPSNNDPMNLIPLCPNCHLTDQHNPTGAVEPSKLRLFRQYKDPMILTPKFHAVLSRARFLDEIPSTEFRRADSDLRRAEMDAYCDEALKLIALVERLEMGDFYAEQLVLLMFDPRSVPAIAGIEPVSYLQFTYNKKMEYNLVTGPNRLCKVRDEVYELLVEMLRFQDWHVNE